MSARELSLTITDHLAACKLETIKVALLEHTVGAYSNARRFVQDASGANKYVWARFSRTSDIMLSLR